MGKDVGLPPFVQRFRDRGGKLRYYLRKKGCKRVALPSPLEGKQAFAAAYIAAMADQPPLKSPKAGTLDSLINEYLASSEFRAKKPNTQTTYRNAIAFLRSRESIAMPVADITRPKLEKLRDEIAKKTPGKANIVMAVMKLLLDFATRREGYRTDNPALKIRSVKGGEYRSWTDAELLQFEAHWPRGTTERLIYELALYTGQRRGDIAKMTWGDVRDGVVYVCQEKTGTKVSVPCHGSLTAELGLVPKSHAVIVATETGRSFSPPYLGRAFAGAIKAAGLPKGCVLHGLRKAAARRLAEIGCSDREIMAITGHQTTAMVSHYVKEADGKVMARNAIVRLDRERPLSNPVKPARKSLES